MKFQSNGLNFIISVTSELYFTMFLAQNNLHIGHKSERQHFLDTFMVLLSFLDFDSCGQNDA